MYYYVLEQTTERTSGRFRDRLVDQTTDLGIAGEIVTASPLKSADELIDLGIKKGYTTIVAVGSDVHISRVITALMHRPVTDRPVLGVIPTQATTLIGVALGTPTLQSALQALKARRLAYATLAEIDPGKFILTQATMTSVQPVRVEIEVDSARAELQATELVLTGDCHLEVHNRGSTGERLKRGLAWFFGASVLDRSTSVFHGEHLRISTDRPISVLFGTDVIATTPIAVHVIRRALKIIIARATVSQESKGETSPNQLQEKVSQNHFE